MSEKETKGRKKVYTDKIMMEIMEEYCNRNPHVMKLVPNKLAKFAQEEFGYTKIRYSQFTNSPAIKKRIDDFNETHNKILMPNKVSKDKFAKINTDALVDAYYKEPLKLKSAMRQFNDKYMNVCKDVIKQRHLISDLNNELENLNQRIIELENKNKELIKRCAESAKKNKDSAAKIANANRVEKFMRSLDVYEHLLEKGMVERMDEDNLKLLLFNAGLLKESEKVRIENYLNPINFEDNETSPEDTLLNYESDDYEEEFIEDFSEEDYLSFFEGE